MSNVASSYSNLVTRLIGYPLGFLSSIIVARVLGPEDRGLYSYILVILSFVLPIFTLGIGAGFTFYISNGKYKLSDVFFTVLIFGFFTGVLLSIIIAALWYFNLLGETGKLISTLQIGLISSSLILTTINFFIGRLMFGEGMFKLQNYLSVIIGFVSPLLMMILVGYFNFGVNGALVTYFFVQVLSLIWLTYSVIKNFYCSKAIKISFLQESVHYGFKGWIGDVALRANVRLDQIILGSVASASNLGIYSIAVLLAELIWIVPDSIGPILFNKLAINTSDNTRIDLVYKISRLLLGTGLLLSICLIIFTKFIILPFGYGKEYIGSFIPLLIILPGSIFYIIAKVITKLFSGSGDIGLTSRSQLYGSIISVTFFFILIPSFDIIGAAIASTLGYISVSLFCLYYFQKNYGRSLMPFFYFNYSDYIWAYQLIRNK
jgi:O-antigen/teichoic acid export membrane protein